MRAVERRIGTDANRERAAIHRSTQVSWGISAGFGSSSAALCSRGAFPVPQCTRCAGTGQQRRWIRAFPAGTTGAAARDAAGARTGRGRDVTALPGDTALCSWGGQWASGEVTSCRRRRLLIGRPCGEQGGGGRDAGAAPASGQTWLGSARLGRDFIPVPATAAILY